MINLLISAFIGYILGSIPFGLILVRVFKNVDIRGQGSGNIGATNALRVGGKLLGALTLFFDALKCIIAMMASSLLFDSHNCTFIAGCAALLGHIFPVWLGFKGGKGVAVYVGFLLWTKPLLFGVFMVVWLLLFGIKKISSLSAICAVLFVALVAIAFLPPGLLLCSVLFSSALILYKHIPNMMRLIRGQEGRIEKL